MELGMLGTRRAVGIDADQTVEAASFAMRRQKIDRVVVMQRSGGASAPLGILSASDIVTRVVALGLDASVVTVGDLLWEVPARARVSDTVPEALERLSAAGAEALPVVDGEDRLIGVVLLEDLQVALSGIVSPATIVFIVDDDPSIREALVSLIRSAGLRAAAFSSGAEFLSAARTEYSACLVLDVRMPLMGGFDLQRRLAALGWNIPVIFITGHGDIPMSVRAMKAGAIDFLTKPFRDDDLLASIGHALTMQESARAEREHAMELRHRFAMLTRREREVMQHVVKGLLNKQIAAALGVAEITVKVHRRRVMDKMRAASLVELVHLSDALASDALAHGYTKV